MEFNLKKEESSIIKVIGVGGGGSNAVNHMYRQGIKGVDFLICNTDQQALDLSPVPNKIQLGASLTEGRGAGSKPEVGKNAAIESVDELKELFEKNTQMVFITAGMGGGTGTGAAPVIAKTAREMGILTVGIVTIPFGFEGQRRRKQADAGLEELRGNVDTLLTICNDKLREMHGNLKMSEAFSKADDILATAAKGIAEIITRTGYINVDFEDVKTVMQEGGTAIMGSATAEGEGRAIKAVSHALASPLLNDNDITGANHILVNVTFGDEELAMDETEEIMAYIQGEAGNTADIIWGTGSDDNLGNKLGVTIIATGFGSKDPAEMEEMAQYKKVKKLNDDVPTNITQGFDDVDKSNSKGEKNPLEPTLKEKSEANQETINFTNIYDNDQKNKDGEEIKRYTLDGSLGDNQPEVTSSDEVISKKGNVSKKIEDNSNLVEDEDEDEEEIETKSTLDRKEQELKNKERMSSLGNLSRRFRKPGGLTELEKEPAFVRRKIDLEDTPHSSESNVSRYSLTEDEEKKTSLKQNNSFLHDNVD